METRVLSKIWYSIDMMALFRVGNYPNPPPRHIAKYVTGGI